MSRPDLGQEPLDAASLAVEAHDEHEDRAVFHVQPRDPEDARQSAFEQLAARARAHGFVRWGVARATALPQARARFEAWLGRGFAGEMNYLSKRRTDPHQLLADAESVIVVALPYGADQLHTHSAVAAYAKGADYHIVLRRKLRAFAQDCADVLGVPLRARVCVDTAPMLERAWAAQAGVGFTGKSTLTIAPGVGSAFVLGELLLNVALPPSEPIAEGCGSCTACLDACPTRAFVDAFTLDARRCVSYLTIEHPGSIPRELRPGIGLRVFGCDECQRVCPFNASRKLPKAAGELEPTLPEPDLLALLELGSGQYRRWTRNSARNRVSRQKLQRNAAIALGNRRRSEDVPRLLLALASNPYANVRAHVAWALGNIGSQAALEGLSKALLGESDPAVQEEIRTALASHTGSR